MKELSIEQKATAYDEAIVKSVEFLNLCKKCGAKDTVDFLEGIFPELKEGEDEKIRKEILQSIRDNMVVIHKDKCIAWIEKQEGCEYIKKDWLEHIKQSWYKEGFIDGKYSGGASKEWTTNDAATLKELIDFLENGTAKLQHDLTRYANWLKIQFTPIEKQGEQKPVDNIEPKFKVGDWITDGNNALLCVEKFEIDYGYELKATDGQIFHFVSPNLVDANYHLWTIQDARDGDVLVNGSNIFIFHFINDTRLMGYCHVNTDDGRCYDDIGKNECFCLIDAVVNPATKEQRDLLFKKMKELGYEWDAEKKELKKISQHIVSAEAKEALYDKPTDNDMVEALRTEYEKGRADVLRCIDPDVMVADFCSQPLSKTRSIASVYRQGITDILKRINNNEETSITGTLSIDDGGVHRA